MAYSPAFSDVSATISIAANATSSGACTAISGASIYTVQLSGTFVATVQFQLTRDGVNWVNVTGANSVTNAATGAYVSSITAPGIYQLDVAGCAGARVITTAYTSGTVTGTAAISAGVGSVTLEGIAAVTATVGNLASAAAQADGQANPTTAPVEAFDARYNGATWDRARNNWNTTTGDTGAKTASFNGATQTNFDARGAMITVLCGTVSGTSPAMVVQLQWSPDAGTTWLNLGAATGLASTGATGTIAIYPTQWETATSATLAALTVGATAFVALNSPLPRSWRLAYAISGTTPSFTITGVYVNYLI